LKIFSWNSDFPILAFAKSPKKRYAKEQVDVIQKGEAMIAVQGLYTGGDTVKIDTAIHI
jgi:hypothetical protein